MTDAPTAIVDAMTPTDAYAALAASESAALVDVRTRAEWTFTGLPEIGETGKPLWPVEWAGFPAMVPDPAFVETLVDAAGGAIPDRLFFICRSGARSLAAAQAVAAASQAAGRPIHCTNVAEGFEGDLDPEGHRGTVNGWKARGLPWRQS